VCGKGRQERVIEKGNPRLSRGDLKSLTNPGVV